MAHIKKGDTVYILTGSDKGKKGTVLDLCFKKDTVKVQGVALKTRHIKPRRSGDKGSIRTEESYIHISNVIRVAQ
jgi:large subunit ribosomal protein L24